MSKATTTTADTRTVLWRARVISALRTTLACTIVGCTSLYGPPSLRRHLQFPAFSYVTTILIASDATLGDTLRGCWHVFCATLQAMILSTAGSRLIGPANLTVPLAVVAVAAGAFVVAMPESSHLMSKKIAFGQLVIVYVKTVIDGAGAGVMVHPIHVASSTALGALASVVAMLFPYPHLACHQRERLGESVSVVTEQNLQCENIPIDVESGYANAYTFNISCASGDADNITGSFLQQLEEAANMIQTNKDEEILTGQFIFHYSCLGFCIVSLMREATNIENEVKQLLLWENPSSRTNLNEIYCKINALRSE